MSALDLSNEEVKALCEVSQEHVEKAFPGLGLAISSSTAPAERTGSALISLNGFDMIRAGYDETYNQYVCRHYLGTNATDERIGKINDILLRLIMECEKAAEASRAAANMLDQIDVRPAGVVLSASGAEGFDDAPRASGMLFKSSRLDDDADLQTTDHDQMTPAPDPAQFWVAGCPDRAREGYFDHGPVANKEDLGLPAGRAMLALLKGGSGDTSRVEVIRDDEVLFISDALECGDLDAFLDELREVDPSFGAPEMEIS